MYALYSKAFAKKGADLNKKEFNAGYDNKVTLKGGADGTTFEVNASTFTPTDVKKDPKTYTTDVKIETAVDDAFTVSLKIDQGNDAVVEASSKISDALKVTLTAKNPEPAATNTVDGEFEFLDSAFSAEGKFSVLDKGKLNLGVSCGLATGLPGFDGVTVGANPGFSLSGKSLDCPFAVGYGSKTFQLSLDSGYSMAHGGMSGGALRGWFQTNDKLAVAFEASQSAYTFGKGGTHTAGKATKADDAGLTFKVGAEYKLGASTTGKARYTFANGKAGELDLALKQALDGKSSLSTGFKMTDGKPKVCFTYNLE